MNRIVVIGGATVDILAQSNASIIIQDSNPGKVKLSYGGVGHNIASNLGRMGLPVSFITAFSRDAFSRGLIEDCLASNLDISESQHFADQSSSLYVAILQHDGDMNVAIADMEILSQLDTEKIEPVLQKMDEDDILVIDTNLTVEQIGKLIAGANCRVFADPISVSKASKLTDYYSYLDFFKPNELEAENLSGISCNNPRKALEFFIERGVGCIAISRGEKGVIASDGQQYVRLKSPLREVVSTTGAGDSFMAGFIYGSYHGYGFIDCLYYATAASWLTIESMDTVSPVISEKLLNEYYQKVRESTEIESID